MNILKKTVALLVAAMMLITVVFTGCGKVNGNTDQKNSTQAATTTSVETTKQNIYDNGLSKDENVTLKIIAPDQGYGKEMFETAANNFMKSFPNVKIELTTSPKYSELLTPRISANDDKEMFNLIFGTAGYTNALSDSGVVEDLNDMMKMCTWDSKDITLGQDIDESYRAVYSYKDKLDLLPMDMTVVGIVYNKGMFEENGWNQDPKTWGEFLQLCEAIKTSGKAAPIAFAGTVGYLHWLTDMASLYAGGKDWENKFINRDKGIYSDPVTLAPLTKLKELKDKGYFLKGTEALDHTQSQMEFLQGKAAMVPCGNWIENEMKNSAPEGFKYGIMIQPTNDNPADVRYISGFNSALWMWAKKPDLEKKWAKEFIRYYFSKEIQSIFIKNGGIPISKSLLEDSELRSLAGVFNQEVIKLLSGKVEFNLALSLPAPKVSASAKFGDIDWKIFNKQFLAVYLGTKTPEQIGKEADTVLEEAWQEVGGR